MAVFEDLHIENQTYTDGIIQDVFDNCTFSKCDFTNSKTLSCQFNDCIFTDCNFSMTDITQSTMNNAAFKNCKILGVKFNHCNDFIFEVAFDNCILDYSSFEKRKMSKTIFRNSSLKGVDFGGADLRQAKFLKCDLNEAMFYNTNLQNADFISAYNYIIDPAQNSIKKASFSKDGLAGLLAHFNIIIEE